MTKTEPDVLFFLGKGGTGKSTCAALCAIDLAGAGFRVCLSSFDDAHNLCDIFQTTFSHAPKTILPGLEVIQVDKDREIASYLSGVTRKVKRNFTYLTAFNLGNYFDVLKLSPGMEAHALAACFTGLKKKYMGWDYLIIDMPPTALSLSFFNLPTLSLLWVNQLEKLRLEINKKKEIISKIKLVGKEITQDKVLARIMEIKSDHLDLKSFFEHKAKCYAVHNTDALSLAETKRIFDQLSILGIKLAGLFCNHRTPDDMYQSAADPELPCRILMDLPYCAQPLVGLDTLTRFTRQSGLNLAEELKESVTRRPFQCPGRS
ncbi:ArsA-related P-loop ATPase [uncultured Desulfobacter sp.]|uniref:ArsA family ATPase n=1 Tax=uncultured Desulfobacter sp. TaxID=240139 RepID=UPI0029F5416E|nr:ArsA-related P-loop ATPase [uncultured Desulfobacter sp.]